MEADLLSQDRALLERFRKGERTALMQVWQNYHPLIEGLARRGFGPWRGFTRAIDIEDAVSSTFAAAFEESCRLRYDGLTPYSAFLLGIARNVMRRQIKKETREESLDPLTSLELKEDAPTPEEQLLSREETEILARFCKTLDEDEAWVFHGYYRDGLSEERLASSSGRTRYRVRKLLHKVQRKLKRYLRSLDTARSSSSQSRLDPVPIMSPHPGSEGRNRGAGGGG